MFTNCIKYYGDGAHTGKETMGLIRKKQGLVEQKQADKNTPLL